MIKQLTQPLGFSMNSQLASGLWERWGTLPCGSMLLLVRYTPWGHLGQDPTKATVAEVSHGIFSRFAFCPSGYLQVLHSKKNVNSEDVPWSAKWLQGSQHSLLLREWWHGAKWYTNTEAVTGHQLHTSLSWDCSQETQLDIQTYSRNLST